MGDLTFGAPLGLLEKSDYTPWVATIFMALKFGTYVRGLKSFYVFKVIIDFLGPKALGAKRNAHFNYAAMQVDKRLEIKTERPDIWGLVLRQAELGRALSLKEMHSNAALFMGAGTGIDRLCEVFGATLTRSSRNNRYRIEWTSVSFAQKPTEDGQISRCAPFCV